MPNYITPKYEFIEPIDAEVIYLRIERIARTCYKTEGRIGPGTAVKLVRNLVKRGHWPMLDHIYIAVRFISDRGFTHELVRHRLAAYAQESTRFCDYGGKGINLVHPPGLTDAQRNRRELHFWMVQGLYDTERLEGVPPEIARGVLPTCLKTEIVMTCNLTEWRHVFDLRAIGKAGKPHPQMIELMVPLRTDFKIAMPDIFGAP